ncbi:MAG: sulfite exporter TauE/SafE family protein [Magnetococcales bacterium]|nr:sulfite exporter TauE/SafE family protein [Magnetococcales bacterium]NGZ27678.1 sulfite exporter TauE/SafE family protein [Magnetococcales bacterium]
MMTGDYLAALGLGLASGMTVCALSCLPTIGAWVLGQERDGGGGLRDALLFLLGRWSGYVLMGTMVGIGSAAWLTSPGWRWLGGVLLVVAGLRMLQKRPSGCGAGHPLLPPFQLGLAQSMTPCPPLVGLLTLAGLSGDGFTGAMLAGLFGVGAMVSPLLILIPVLAGAGRAWFLQTSLRQPWLQWAGSFVLILMGLRQMPWG